MSVHAEPGDGRRGRAIKLTDRDGERDALDRLIGAIREARAKSWWYAASRA